MPDVMITIAIADDHPVVRDGLRRILETEQDFKVIGEAADGLEAIRIVRQLKPAILLLDLFMPNSSGFDVLRELEGTDTRFLILTAGNKRNDLVEAVRCQAHGILTKDAPVENLLKAIRCVAAGEYWIERDLLASALQHQPLPLEQFGLTDRELEVVAEIAAGLNNRDIANKLGISELTVKRHLTNIFDKLGVVSRLELALFAVSHNLPSRS
jgi:two-component system, NarL family, nitrate/nitrite response regulator NarL